MCFQIVWKGEIKAEEKVWSAARAFAQHLTAPATQSLSLYAVGLLGYLPNGPGGSDSGGEGGGEIELPTGWEAWLMQRIRSPPEKLAHVVNLGALHVSAIPGLEYILWSQGCPISGKTVFTIDVIGYGPSLGLSVSYRPCRTKQPEQLPAFVELLEKVLLVLPDAEADTTAQELLARARR